MSVTETNEAQTIVGQLTIEDIDAGENFFSSIEEFEGEFGTFSIDEDGQWTFVANSAFDQLNVGDSVEESFTVTSIDGTPATVTVTITGTNDAAVITGDFSGTAEETNEAVTITGQLTSTDVDNEDNVFTAATVEGTNGTFSIDAEGAWTFEANQTFDYLNEGDSG